MAEIVHPSHYNVEGRKECIVEMEEKFGPKAVFAFELLSAYKYLYRAGEKKTETYEDDMNKCKTYFEMAKDLLNREYLVGNGNMRLYDTIRRAVWKYANDRER